MSADNDKYATSSAVTEHSLIWSEEGLSIPERLSIGDNVITSDGKLVPVKDIVDCGERSIYRVTLSNGMRTDSTYGRSLMVEGHNGTVFKPVEDIKPGDRVVTVSDPKHPAGANATCTEVGNGGLMVLERATLKNVIALLLTGHDDNGAPRSDIDINDDNDITLTFEAVSHNASSDLQQILLARFGVRTDRFRSMLTITNEQLKLLANKVDFIDMVLPTSSCPLSDSQFDDMLSLSWYTTDRELISFPVTDVAGRKRCRTYGIVLDNPYADIIVDGMVSDTLKLR